LLVALAYEIIFEIPVSQIFPGFRSVVKQSVLRNLEDLKADLKTKSGRPRGLSAEKARWLTRRQIG